MEGHGQSSEAKEFADAAQLALMTGGEFDYDDRIIIDGELIENFPCQADVVFEAAQLCSPLTSLFLDIFEHGNDVNVNFKSSNAISGNANTSTIINYDPIDKTCYIDIKFRESYLDAATDLSIARTAIHESMHAILVYMLLEGKFVTTSGQPDAEYAELMNGFADYLATNNPTLYGNAQHNVMIGLIDDIATSLSSYGQNNGYSNSFSYYKDMAWGGLTHLKNGNNIYANPLFEQSIPNSSDRNRILSRLESESTNNVINGIIPKGVPCD